MKELMHRINPYTAKLPSFFRPLHKMNEREMRDHVIHAVFSHDTAYRFEGKPDSWEATNHTIQVLADIGWNWTIKVAGGSGAWTVSASRGEEETCEYTNDDLNHAVHVVAMIVLFYE